MTLARRLLSFSTIPAISALVPFLVLPVIGHVADESAWVAVALGQSVGGFAALIVSLGLNLVGPTLVSLAPDGERAELFATGTRARISVAVPAAAVAAVVALLLSPSGDAATAAVMAIAIAIGGLSSSWYLIGLGTPLPLIAYELLPRAAATLAGGVIILTGGAVIWYPLLLLVAVVIGIGSYASTVMNPVLLLSSGWRRSVSFTREHLGAAGTEIVSGAYTALAVTLVTAGGSVAAAAAYSSGDKLFRMGQTVIGAQGNALQGWVVEDARAHLRSRARTAILLHAALGIVGLAAFSLLGPWLAEILFDKAIDPPTAVLFGVAVLCISLTTAIGRHLLIALGRSRSVFASVIAGAVVGIPATLVLSSLWGAVGGAAGLAAAEVAVLLLQLVFAARAVAEAREAGTL